MTGACVLAFVGPRAAGKTTLARAMGTALGWPVVDTDARIAEQVGCAAGEFLARRGERAFRAVEEPVCLAALGEPPPRVVALGGGAVRSAAVRNALRDAGVFVVGVEAPADCLVARLKGSAISRPRLSSSSLEDEVSDILAARAPLYRDVARISINTFSANVDACVAQILDKMAPS